MATIRARTFEYGVSLDRDWSAASDRGGAAMASDERVWAPEHLLLTGLARCVLTSLAYHARRAGVEAASSATARGTVTRREEDGRFAFVEIDVDAEVALEPSLDEAAIRHLVGKAERDCFVGASLRLQPAYRWTVGGRVLS
ncbi:MAG TPA: OsmC family protein [Gaiellaceae bacterium]|jgi:organic hydroperoxide reductase OsmC/OhrA